jgi:hypothetical protein
MHQSSWQKIVSGASVPPILCAGISLLVRMFAKPGLVAAWGASTVLECLFLDGNVHGEQLGR